MAEEGTVTAKSVAMCVLFCASMLLGTLPILLSRLFKWDSEAKNSTYVQTLLCIGGGVLLCTTFLHLLPEVSERIDELEYVPKYQIHYAELLMCTGFFAMYFVEECVHAYLHHRQKHITVLKRSLSIRRGDNIEDEKTNGKLPFDDSPINICVEDQKHKKHDHEHDHEHNHEHKHFVAEEDDSALKTLRGLLVVLALSMHELFEGLAVGLEGSTSNVWYMFGAVSAHKLVIAFCIGVELVTSDMRIRLVIIYVFTFAVVSPLGIGIGIILSEKGGNSMTIPSIFLQGLASGTLLYVVFFEILSTERKSGLKKFSAVFIGFSLMLGITFLE